MANLKPNKNPETSSVKLLPAGTVRKNIDSHTGQIALGLAGLHDDMVQCMKHAELHGDITLAQYLMQSVRDRCKGVVVAGIAQWFGKFSPIKLTSKDGVVSAQLLKDGEKGYKGFKSAEAEATPAMESKEVTDRSTRPIVKPTIAYFKSRISGFAKQVDNYNERAEIQDKLTPEEVKTVKLWLGSVTEYGNKVTVLAEEGRVEVRIPAAIRQTKRASRTEQDELKSETRKTA
jgi:hypothetical protein